MTSTTIESQRYYLNENRISLRSKDRNVSFDLGLLIECDEITSISSMKRRRVSEQHRELDKDLNATPVNWKVWHVCWISSPVARYLVKHADSVKHRSNFEPLRKDAANDRKRN